MNCAKAPSSGFGIRVRSPKILYSVMFYTYELECITYCITSWLLCFDSSFVWTGMCRHAIWRTVMQYIPVLEVLHDLHHQ